MHSANKSRLDRRLQLADIVPNTGVAALIGDQQVAVFRIGDARRASSPSTISTRTPGFRAVARAGRQHGRAHRGGLADLQAAFRPGQRRVPGSARALGGGLARACLPAWCGWPCEPAPAPSWWWSATAWPACARSRNC
jgi:hypothetical protein